MSSQFKPWHNKRRKQKERKHFRKKFAKQHPNSQLPNELEADILHPDHGQIHSDSETFCLSEFI